ncbi:hypothetical protein SCP_0705030 [Sparassis crispa]|uniref:Uncharacterized protein n=1 Tax=Sparassis crispa TaxID=139825 RepID=A0A401GSX9_9APHY|nr:hypothetical protein SCP_0705030 [Sparassis crispa]GBE85316.1 hypothetical protein SCP_0705030 [Sparassis crispa]
MLSPTLVLLVVLVAAYAVSDIAVHGSRTLLAVIQAVHMRDFMRDLCKDLYYQLVPLLEIASIFVMVQIVQVRDFMGGNLAAARMLMVVQASIYKCNFMHKLGENLFDQALPRLKQVVPPIYLHTAALQASLQELVPVSVVDYRTVLAGILRSLWTVPTALLLKISVKCHFGYSQMVLALVFPLVDALVLMLLQTNLIAWPFSQTLTSLEASGVQGIDIPPTHSDSNDDDTISRDGTGARSIKTWKVYRPRNVRVAVEDSRKSAQRKI